MWISLNKDKDIPLARQIYTQIKHLIFEGNLSSGEKLPSSRFLSKDLGVSRNTVLEAYNQLIAEGYLIGNHGSGTIVAQGITQCNIPSSTLHRQFSASLTTKNNDVIDFYSGIPDLSLFPKKEWGKLYETTCNSLPEIAFSYHSPSGVIPLRKAIAAYLFRTRGLNCNPDNIIIVSGSTQGLSLISTLLYQMDKEVLIEDPTHPGLRQVISKSGLSLKEVCVDDYGFNTDLLKPSDNVSFIYTTPSHQYPLGGILPIQRRLALIQYACSNNCFIVEDDYDSEFRFEGQPVSSLFELNPQRVIYIGTFSKILAPAIRLGYLILPDELVAPFLELKQYSDIHTESITQYVLAAFIENGNLEKHIWKMKKLYAKKRQHLLNELSNYFPGSFEIKGHAAGLHILIRFYNVIFTQELLDTLYVNNVKIYSIENYKFQSNEMHRSEILLGYGHLDFPEISEGIRLLHDTLKTLLYDKK